MAKKELKYQKYLLELIEQAENTKCRVYMYNSGVINEPEWEIEVDRDDVKVSFKGKSLQTVLSKALNL